MSRRRAPSPTVPWILTRRRRVSPRIVRLAALLVAFAGVLIPSAVDARRMPAPGPRPHPRPRPQPRPRPVDVRPAPAPVEMPAQIERRAVDLGDGLSARIITRNGERGMPDAAALSIGDRALRLHEGSPVVGTVATGHGVLIAATAAATGPRFQVHGFEDRGRGRHRVHPVAGGGARGIPFAVAGTPTPDGFAILFQELDANDPSLGRTYLARLDRRGAPTGPAAEIPVPWGIAAVAWNGHGYHVALIYPGGGLPRLSMVSLDLGGRPEQHPDWASRMGLIEDVHLVGWNGRVLAFYRGGDDGSRLLSRDVTAIGNWGREPGPAREVSRMGREDVVLVRVSDDPGGVVRAEAIPFGRR